MVAATASSFSGPGSWCETWPPYPIKPRNRRPFSATPRARRTAGSPGGTPQRCRPTSTSTSTLSCVWRSRPARAKSVRDLLVIDADNDLCLARQFDQATDLGRVDNLVRQQDAADAVLNQAFGFVKRGAGDTDGAGIQLPCSQLRALVVLKMRPELRWHASEKSSHALQVGFHPVEVHQKGRGLDFLFGHCALFLS